MGLWLTANQKQETTINGTNSGKSRLHRWDVIRSLCQQTAVIVPQVLELLKGSCVSNRFDTFCSKEKVAKNVCYRVLRTRHDVHLTPTLQYTAHGRLPNGVPSGSHVSLSRNAARCWTFEQERQQRNPVGMNKTKVGRSAASVLITRCCSIS